MTDLSSIVTSVYLPIVAAVGSGMIFSKLLVSYGGAWGESNSRRIPAFLAQFLLRIGIPIGIANFVRSTELSASAWIAPITASLAIALGLLCSACILGPMSSILAATRRSFQLSSYVGNTSFIGFPVVLLLPQLGPSYFGVAVLYDIFGTVLGGYGLGAWIATRGENGNTRSSWRSAIIKTTQLLYKNPSLLAFVAGLLLKLVELPETINSILSVIAWGSIMLALLTMGMRIQQLSGSGSFQLPLKAVLIKMVAVPLFIGALLTATGFAGPERLILVLQAGMPCAFATLVLAENFNLDRALTVQTLIISNLILLLTLPIWVLSLTSW
ncbi:AEC family transporter [Synechococcus sp. A15-24]|uniref:AEC family transporter n=1 Tax=Synechococcus sp. A15-24 TaxID=1050635 RepID=UPI001648A4D9|nr:AEC family transporter [Synechococcus sp. A15-24]QNJ29661.1 AEC transporter family [Synechococcus sp. A15-24]